MISRCLLAALVLSLAPVTAWAEQWEYLGPSQAGEHYVDRDSFRWDAARATFIIATNVIQPDQSAWLTVMQVDCGRNTFAYLEGIKTQGEEMLSAFSEPKPAQAIVPDSMPDQLKEAYCYANRERKLAEWESLGKSSVAEVFFDRASIRQSQDGARFLAETRVVPFGQQEETVSTILFNCSNHMFTLLKLSKLKDGKLEPVFDRPQPPTSASKTATLETLASRFCGNLASTQASP